MENVSDDAPAYPATKVRQCSKHGAYDSEHIVGGTYMPCPKCMEENEAAMAAEKAAQPPPVDPEVERAARRLVAAGISKRFENATFETYVATEDRQRAVLESVQAYANDFRANYKAGRCMVMVGRPGTGKSHLGYSILRHCMAASDKFTGKMVSISELFRQIKASWDRGSKTTEEQAIARFVQPHLLIIDEIGVQFDSVAEQALLYEVINGRYKAVLPTIVISNLSRAELTEVIGARSFDRLRENGGLIEVFDWASHRVTG